MTSVIITVYLCAAVAAIIALVVAIVLSNKVAYKPDLSDVSKRKTRFWFVSVLSIVLTFLLTWLCVYISLKTNSKKDACLLHMCIGAAVSWFVYVIAGVILSKSNKQGKLGSWF